nr:hypothetical protein [Bifidobacterium bifidum]
FNRDLLFWPPQEWHVLTGWILFNGWIEQLLSIPGSRRVIVAVSLALRPEDIAIVKGRWVRIQMIFFDE